MTVATSSGVYELDANGLVLFSSIKSDDGKIRRIYDLEGLPFFSMVSPFSHIAEFRFHFEHFRESNSPSMTYDFKYETDAESRMIRVLLARLMKGEGATSYLVYVRPGF